MGRVAASAEGGRAARAIGPEYSVRFNPGNEQGRKGSLRRVQHAVRAWGDDAG